MVNAKYSLFVLVLVAFSSSAFSIRCNSRLVNEGDVGDKFKALCGQPSQIDTRVIYRTVLYQNGVRRVIDSTEELSPARFFSNSTIVFSNTQVIKIEHWHYNFGPRRFMHRVVFENGIAQSIEQLGYGY
jgi:hypothetical protein